MTRRGLAELLAIVAPPVCVACRTPLEQAEDLVCGPCLRELPWLRGHRCPRCALPRHSRGGCPASGAAFDRSWAPMAYDGVARQLVQALKFRAALPAAQLIAAQMAATLPAGWVAGDVVAVPPQPRRRRVRGFDAADLVAAALARRLGLALAPGLVRSDRAARQTRAGLAVRRRADRLAIAALAPAPERVLLVDDVHTTGMTLDVCARALRAAGCRDISAITYARTL